MPSTKGEGHERRYFYGTVWAMCIAQPALWLMWYVVPDTRVGNSLKLAIFPGDSGVPRQSRATRAPAKNAADRARRARGIGLKPQADCRD